LGGVEIGGLTAWTLAQVVAGLPVAVSVLLAVDLLLAAALAVRLLVGRLRPSPESRRRSRSAASWLGLGVAFTVAVAAGPWGVAVLLAVVSGAGLRELLRLAPPAAVDRPVARWLPAVVLWQYPWVALGRFELAATGLAAGLPLLLGARRVLLGRFEEMAGSTGRLVTAVLLTVYAPSWAAFLAALPAESNPRAGGLGWLVYLVVLTELNDISQAGWGRRLGRRPLAPVLSPAKTWGGLVGGLLTTSLAAVALAPVLTPWLEGGWRGAWWPALVGALVSAAATVGDLTVSAYKREADAGPSGRTVPGQGGVLDRLDSLLFAAPVLFVLVWALHGGR